MEGRCGGSSETGVVATLPDPLAGGRAGCRGRRECLHGTVAVSVVRAPLVEGCGVTRLCCFALPTRLLRRGGGGGATHKPFAPWLS